MSEPVTCLMPVRNGEKYLTVAIQSILDQTYDNFEFLIVNDNSTDDTFKIIKSFDDPRIKFLRGPGKGISVALNIGIKEATTDLIFRMDGDDISASNRFELQLEEFYRLNKPDIMGTANEVISETGVLLGSDIPPKNHDDIVSEASHLGNAICHPTALIKRDSINKIGGYDENISYCEDIDLFLRMSFDYRLANIPRLLYKLRKHDQSETGKKRDKILARTGLIWWSAATLQKYQLMKEGYGEIWNNPESRETLFELLEKKISNSLFEHQMLFTREMQVAKSDMTKPGKRLSGLGRALSALRYPDALLARIVNSLLKRGFINPPDFVSIDELNYALKDKLKGTPENCFRNENE